MHHIRIQDETGKVDGLLRGVRQIAAALGTTPAEATKLLAYGKFPGRKLGPDLRSYVVLRSQLRAYLDQLGDATPEVRAAIGVTKVKSKRLRRATLDHELQQRIDGLMDGVATHHVPRVEGDETNATALAE